MSFYANKHVLVWYYALFDDYLLYRWYDNNLGLLLMMGYDWNMLPLIVDGVLAIKGVFS